MPEGKGKKFLRGLCQPLKFWWALVWKLSDNFYLSDSSLWWQWQIFLVWFVCFNEKNLAKKTDIAMQNVNIR